MTTDAVVPTAAVRVATPADVGLVIEMAERAASRLRGQRGADVMLAREATVPSATRLAEWMSSGDATVLLGLLDGQPVGVIAAHVDVLVGGERLAVIPVLWVDEEARAVSVGEALLNAIVDWARAQGCAALDAYALPGERITKNFFEAAGFKARLLTVHHRLDDSA
ncbi:MAG: GNAT family N-acetyltransferase [Actinobacteria bacterium]|nr:GNAT family N-acetyltransferase [Actinomycetota bacterium]